MFTSLQRNVHKALSIVVTLTLVLGGIPAMTANAASILPSESFGSSVQNNVATAAAGWVDSDGTGNNARVETATDRTGSPTTGHVRLRQGASVTKSINASGFQNIFVKYYWRGDFNAESSDKLRVYWRIGGSGIYTEATVTGGAPHALNNQTWSGQESLPLPPDVNNASNLEIRFVGDTNSSSEEARIDDVSITGDVIPTELLSLSLTGTGSGVVTSAPAGINCGVDCTESYTQGTSVTLTAAASTGSTFTGWSGACTGTGSCVVSMTSAKSVTATFTLNTYTLTAAKIGTGTGVVTSNPAGINCGGDCSEVYGHGSVVILTATPDVGSTFAGWSGGGCAGTGTCTVTVTSASTVTATFTLIPPTTATIVAKKIVCDSETDLPNWGAGGPNVTESTASTFLATHPNCHLQSGWSFEWGPETSANAGNTLIGSAGGSWTMFGPTDALGSATTTVVVNSSTNDKIWVREVLQSGYISFAGGTDPAVSAEMYCHTDVLKYDNHESVNNPLPGSTYQCIAFNVPVKHTLTVAVAGGGSVTSSPTGISCAADCDENYNHGTVVTLTAIPDGLSTFAGWSGGGCSGTGSCVVTMDAAKSVTASFIPVPQCPSGTTGIFPVCIPILECPPGTTGTFPVCIPDITPSATIVATKIVCDSEADLPNWSGSGMDINADTASDWINGNEELEIAAHPNCHLASDWRFQWAPIYDGESPVPNPGDNTGVAASPWTTFGPTNGSGVASVAVPLESVSGGQVWVREVWNSEYIPFSQEFVSGPSVSAEMWCDGDVLNYDNLDYASSLTDGATTYCIAFNAPQPLSCEPQVNLVGNGGFEDPTVSSNDWTLATFGGTLIWSGNIIPSADLEQTGEVLEIQNNVAGAPHGGNQHAELDGWHPTTIFQDIETIPGKEYKLSYFFSPRPNTAAEENQLEVSIEDGVVANHTGVTTENATEWTEYTKSFVATDNMTRIRFTENGPDDVGGGLGSYLDDVSLKCVGDPVDQCPGVEGIQLTNAQCSGGGGGYHPPVVPQCANGMDDDNDGLIDAYDPGCHAGDIMTGLMNPDDNDESTPPPAVLGAATSTDNGTGSSTPEVVVPPPAPACKDEYITSYMGKGKKNDPEQVKKLQEFLNSHENAGIEVTGVYDDATFNAVKAFQIKYMEEILGPWVKGKFMTAPFATGYVYKTTKRWINMLMCQELNLPVPQLP